VLINYGHESVRVTDVTSVLFPNTCFNQKSYLCRHRHEFVLKLEGDFTYVFSSGLDFYDAQFKLWRYRRKDSYYFKDSIPGLELVVLKDKVISVKMLFKTTS
jgi:hypothetical protein